MCMNKHADKAKNIIVTLRQEILFLRKQNTFVEDIAVRIDADIVLMGIIQKLYDGLKKKYRLDTVNL